MPYTVLGEGYSESRRTPTLKQLLERNPEITLPEVSLVEVVFKPNKFPSFGFVTETGFRVSIPEESPLFATVVREIESWLDSGACLGIKVLDRKAANWQLVSLDSEEALWKETPFGWTLELVTPRKYTTRPQSPAGTNVSKAIPEITQSTPFTNVPSEAPRRSRKAP